MDNLVKRANDEGGDKKPPFHRHDQKTIVSAFYDTDSSPNQLTNLGELSNIDKILSKNDKKWQDYFEEQKGDVKTNITYDFKSILNILNDISVKEEYDQNAKDFQSKIDGNDDDNTITVDGTAYSYKIDMDSDFSCPIINLDYEEDQNKIIKFELILDNSNDDELKFDGITAKLKENDKPLTIIEPSQKIIILPKETKTIEFEADLKEMTLSYQIKTGDVGKKKNPIHRFGLFSDIHVTNVTINDVENHKILWENKTGDGTVLKTYYAQESDIGSMSGGYQDFEHALGVLEANGIKSLYCCGDFGMNTASDEIRKDRKQFMDILKESAWGKNNFNSNNSEYEFYSCTGNHDRNDPGNLQPYNKTTNIDGMRDEDWPVDSTEYGFCWGEGSPESSGSRILSINQKRYNENLRDKDEKENPLHNYAGRDTWFSRDGDWYYFMSFERHNTSQAEYMNAPYQYPWNQDAYDKKESIAHLDDVIKASDGKLLFLFMHFPLNNTEISKRNKYWNWQQYPGLRDNGGTSDSWPNCYGFARESPESKVILEKLLDRDGQTIVMSGHTHYQFECELTYPNINFLQLSEKLTLVHVPSLNYIRDIYHGVVNDDAPYRQESQGYIVDVFDDKIVFKGWEFNPSFSVGSQYYNRKNYGKQYLQYTYTVPRLSQNRLEELSDQSVILTREI